MVSITMLSVLSVWTLFVFHDIPVVVYIAGPLRLSNCHVTNRIRPLAIESDR
jgi:hypothetical protein